jgi:hypothetical protein
LSKTPCISLVIPLHPLLPNMNTNDHVRINQAVPVVISEEQSGDLSDLE